MAKPLIDYQAIFRGDWRTLPRHCGGNVEVMDQTVGCPECGQNLWYTPSQPIADGQYGQPALLIANPVRGKNGQLSGADCLPPWAPPWVGAAIMQYEDVAGVLWPYDVYNDMLSMVHPFQFDDAQDDGDAAYEGWPAQGLLVTVVQRERWPRTWWQGAQD